MSAVSSDSENQPLSVLMRSGQYQQRLSELSDQTGLSCPELLEQSLRLVCDFYGYARGLIAQVQGETMNILAYLGPELSSVPLVAMGPVELAGSFSEYIYTHEGVLTLQELLSDPDPSLNLRIQNFGISALIGKLIRVQGRPFGVIVCYDQQTCVYGQRPERSFMQCFGTWIGLMLERYSFIEQLQKVNKNSFVAVVAHDLRSPVSAIQGAKWMMDEKQIKRTPLEARLLKVIENACQAAHTLIDELLEVTDLQYQRLAFELKPHPLAELIQQRLALFATRCQEQGLQLTWTNHAGPVWVALNPELFLRALEKILDNALKFTPAEGQIRVDLERFDAVVSVSITDTGIGIPVELQAVLFDIFTSARRAGSDGSRPHGLGLHIAREIVHLHGGQIDVTSETGKGSCFRIDLPLVRLLETIESREEAPLVSAQTKFVC